MASHGMLGVPYTVCPIWRQLEVSTVTEKKKARPVPDVHVVLSFWTWFWWYFFVSSSWADTVKNWSVETRSHRCHVATGVFCIADACSCPEVSHLLGPTARDYDHGLCAIGRWLRPWLKLLVHLDLQTYPGRFEEGQATVPSWIWRCPQSSDEGSSPAALWIWSGFRHFGALAAETGQGGLRWKPGRVWGFRDDEVWSLQIGWISVVRLAAAQPSAAVDSALSQAASGPWERQLPLELRSKGPNGKVVVKWWTFEIQKQQPTRRYLFPSI